MEIKSHFALSGIAEKCINCESYKVISYKDKIIITSTGLEVRGKNVSPADVLSG